jgi:hypothetical protein
VAVNHGSWLGVSLEVQAVHTTETLGYYYDPALGDQQVTGASAIDWGVYVGFRLNGVGALVASAAELILGIAAAASLNGGW